MASLGKRKDVYLSGFAQHEAEKLRTKNQEDSTPDEVSVVVRICRSHTVVVNGNICCC